MIKIHGVWFYSSTCFFNFLRVLLSNSFLRRRIVAGVTSTNSSSKMYDRASSKDIRRGGAKNNFSSAVTERIFVSSFPLIGLTSKSFSLLCSPIIIPEYTSVCGVSHEGVSLVLRAGSLRADWAHCSGEGTVGEEPWPQSSAWCEDSGFLGSAQSPLGWWSLGTKRLVALGYPFKLEGSGRSSPTLVDGQVRESFEHPRAASWCNQDHAHGPAFGASEGLWDMVDTGPQCPHECACGMPHLERKECVWCFIIISVTYFPDTALFLNWLFKRFFDMDHF